MDFEIVTDSSSNLVEEMIDDFGLHVLPLTFMVDGEEYQSYLKGQHTIPSDTVCYPAKLLHGHVEALVEEGEAGEQLDLFAAGAAPRRDKLEKLEKAMEEDAPFCTVVVDSSDPAQTTHALWQIALHEGALLPDCGVYYVKTGKALASQKEQEAIQQIENKTYRRSTPTVEEYCEKWLLMQSAQIRMTTLIDYTSKVKNLALLAVVYQNFSLQCFAKEIRWSYTLDFSVFSG